MSDVTVIVCGVCFKPIKGATTLKCNHHFCLSCIQSIMDLKPNNLAEITCVLCGVTTVVNDLHPLLNPKLDQEIATLRSGKKQKFMCQWCDLTPATQQCNTCAAAYCNDCMAFVHKHSARVNHPIGPLVDSPNSFLLRCTVQGHEDYKAEFFCTECDTLCCAYCLRVFPHPNHRNTDVATAAQEAKRKIAAEKPDMERMKKRLDEVGISIAELATRYEASYNDSLTSISERFSRYRMELDELESGMREKIGKLHTDGKTALRTSRLDFLVKMNTFLFALLNVEGSCTDSKVLQNVGFLKKFLSTHSQYLPLTGTGFLIEEESTFQMPELTVQLDLRSAPQAIQIGCGPDSGKLVPVTGAMNAVSFSSPSRRPSSHTHGPLNVADINRLPDASFSMGNSLVSPQYQAVQSPGKALESREPNKSHRHLRGAPREHGKEEDASPSSTESDTDPPGREPSRSPGRYRAQGRTREQRDLNEGILSPSKARSDKFNFWDNNDKSRGIKNRFGRDRHEGDRGGGGRKESWEKGPMGRSADDLDLWLDRRGRNTTPARESKDDLVDNIVTDIRSRAQNRDTNGDSTAGLSPRSPALANRRRRSFTPKDPQVLPRGRPYCCPALRRPLRLTFPVDDDVDVSSTPDGLQFRCIARGNAAMQIGLRSAETLDEINYNYPRDKGVISWRIRLDHITDMFLGVVEYGSPAGTSGVFWKPGCERVVDGELGRVTSLVDKLPVCNTGDILGFLYDARRKELRVYVNNDSLGVLVTDLPGNVGACFILYPGETVTVLY